MVKPRHPMMCATGDVPESRRGDDHHGALVPVACVALPHPARVGVRLVGELDISNHDVLQVALARLAAEVTDVYIDVCELAFIDVGGMTALAEFAHDHRPSRVILERPSALLRRVLDVGWPDCGLELG